MSTTILLPLIAAFAMAPAKNDDLARHVYPLAKRLDCPPVVIDVSDFPESQAWGDAAKALVESWFPTVCSLLATEEYKPPKEIKLVIKKSINSPAYASGGTITINGKWITDHPDDLGMIVHELTHVVQSYPRNQKKPGWLVEGIADYVRWWRYEPEAKRPRIDPEKNKYSDSYRVTAYWLAWVSKKYDMRLVPAIDLALRKAEDPMPIFAKMTGKEPEELWKEFLDSKP